MRVLALRWPLRLLSTVVGITALVACLASAFLAKRVVDDQEHRLLKQRTAEVSSLYDVAITSVRASLGTAAAVASATNADPQTFRVNASKQLLTKTNPSGYAALALVSTRATTPRLVTVVGSGLSPARLSEPEIARALQRASAVGFVTTRVLRVGQALRIGFAAGPPAAPPGYVVYAEQVLVPFAAADTRRTSSTAFAELNGAVYATPTADPSQVLVSSVRQVPLTGSVGRNQLKVGPDTWLIEIKPRHPLVGPAARATPWILLGLGLALTLVMTFVVESVARRRRYAEALVAERTQELRASMDQLESAHEQLVRTERLAAIGEVASAVGHELRNPLGVMANSVYLLRLRTKDPAATRQLDLLDREVQSAERISSDLLDFARSREPVLSRVDLAALVTEAMTVVSKPGSVDVVRHDSSAVGQVDIDRDQIRQVLINLLSNAYEAVLDGGTVTITTERVGDAVRLEIVDDGPGMDESTRARVFEPFFTTKARGTGLGLSVCRQLVERHGGTLRVESSPGTGARFIVVVPTIPQSTAAPTTQSVGAAT